MVHYLLIGDAGTKFNDKINVFEAGYVGGSCGQRHDRTLLDIMPDFF